MKRTMLCTLAMLLAVSMLLFAGCTGRTAGSSAPESTPVPVITPEPVATPEPTPEPTPVSPLADTTWKIARAEQDGKAVEIAQLESVIGGPVSFAFAADGTLKVTAGAQSGEGSWTETNGLVTITVGSSTSALTLEGEKLTLLQADTGIRVELARQ